MSGDGKDTRIKALELAVSHHGAGMQTKNAIPPNIVTVLNTAATFAGFIASGAIPAREGKTK